ncbi:phosphate ABC transporter substrate-binding p rotein, PhoT family [Peptoclostridium acidaminophilum DSM 3953]|uniref:Phosphate ABC transporter substrate-binding p rotein, PhoT family n=1 Tax=Peptoclostridium acidaminophilum DSM 3953 TaxID=1286171 RepID=W8TL11_PEPAC|nr:methyl-accepting chemotaxis protein [Peptoclostridium acidaminophilum]AHM56897.1 phosphate ABC transporter substrate-binding p rotein, PhoT family [Peptoclostridium acidaminophilum DSM 3953]
MKKAGLNEYIINGFNKIKEKTKRKNEYSAPGKLIGCAKSIYKNIKELALKIMYLAKKQNYKGFLRLVKEGSLIFIKNINKIFNSPEVSLRFQVLTVLFAISILPIFLMSSFTYLKVSSHLEDTQRQMLTAKAEGIKSNLDAVLKNSLSIMNGIEAQPDLAIMMEDLNVDSVIDDTIKLNKVSFSLQNAVKSSDKLYETIYICDKNGKIIADGSKFKKEYLGTDISNKDFFKSLDETAELVVGNPFVSKASGKPVIPVAKEIKTVAGKLGVMVVIFDLENFTRPLAEATIGKTGRMYLVNGEGKFIYHKDPKLILKDSDYSFVEKAIKSKAGQQRDEALSFYKENGNRMAAAYEKLGLANWLVIANIEKEELESGTMAIRNFIFFISIAIILLCIVTGYKFSKNIEAPIKSIVSLMHEVSRGRLGVKASFNNNREMKTLNDVFNKMVGELRMLMDNIRLAHEGMSSTSNEINAVSRDAYSFTENVNSVVIQIMEGARTQSANLQEAKARLENLDQMIERSDSHIEDMVLISEDAQTAVKDGVNYMETMKQRSEQGFEYSNDVVCEIEILANEIEKIQRVVTSITAISRKTNLLALNASIEAARAGDAGRGFGVVAQEIRVLAENVNSESEVIKQIISGIKSRTESVVRITSESSSAIDIQRNAVKDTNTAFEKILASMNTMVGNIKLVGENIGDINSLKTEIVESINQIYSIAENAASMTEDANEKSKVQFEIIADLMSNSESLNGLSENLKNSIRIFKLD